MIESLAALLPPAFVERGGAPMQALLRAATLDVRADLDGAWCPDRLFNCEVDVLRSLAHATGTHDVLASSGRKRPAHPELVLECLLDVLRGNPPSIGAWLHALHGVARVAIEVNDEPGALGLPELPTMSVRFSPAPDADQGFVVATIRELLRADLHLVVGEHLSTDMDTEPL